MNITDYVRGLAQWPRWEAEDGQGNKWVVVALNEIRNAIREDVPEHINFGQTKYLEQYGYVIVHPNGQCDFFTTYEAFDAVWQKILEDIWSGCLEQPAQH